MASSRFGVLLVRAPTLRRVTALCRDAEGPGLAGQAWAAAEERCRLRDHHARVSGALTLATSGALLVAPVGAWIIVGAVGSGAALAMCHWEELAVRRIRASFPEPVFPERLDAVAREGDAQLRAQRRHLAQTAALALTVASLGHGKGLMDAGMGLVTATPQQVARGATATIVFAIGAAAVARRA